MPFTIHGYPHTQRLPSDSVGIFCFISMHLLLFKRPAAIFTMPVVFPFFTN